MRNLLALLLFVPSLCLAQAPTYVPADGLVAYYSLDEGSLGDSGLTPSQTAEWTTNRNGETNKASWFDGYQEYVTAGLGYQDFTISAWVLPDGANSNQDVCHGIVSQNAANCNALVFMATCNIPLAANFQVREQDDCAAENVSTGLEHDMWQHLVFVREGGQIQSYRNGALEQSGPGTSMALSPDVPLRIGSMPYGGLFRGFEGGIDDVGVWNRALSEAEIQTLYLAALPVFGCLDSAACNFDSVVTADDGSCEYGCLYCGEGTVWDSTLQKCVSNLTFPTANCGPGTHWDETLSACVADVPSAETAEICTLMSLQELTEGYLNLLGIVAYQDSLLAAEQGNIDGNGNDGTSDDWACGDPVTYWDYDYATVLIGDQCWFAENLKTAVYENGDAIAAGLTDGEWTSTTSGATSTYGEGSSACYESSPDIDACDEVESLQTYGRLYNWYAVNDSRGMCPSDWHVPSDPEWTTLVDHVGAQDFNGSEGTALKAESAWSSGGNGTNDFGFTALPGGHRFQGPPTAVDDGTFNVAGYAGYWWSTTALNNTAWRYAIYTNNTIVGREDDHLQFGFSVRCVKD